MLPNLRGNHIAVILRFEVRCPKTCNLSLWLTLCVVIYRSYPYIYIYIRAIPNTFSPINISASEKCCSVMGIDQRSIVYQPDACTTGPMVSECVCVCVWRGGGGGGVTSTKHNNYPYAYNYTHTVRRHINAKAYTQNIYKHTNAQTTKHINA